RVAELFTIDARYASVDGVISVSGRDNILEYFQTRLTRLGVTNHVTHDRILTLDEARDGRASGVVNSHAEIEMDGELWIASLRYDDRYGLEDGRWRFQSRRMWFFYYCPATQLPDIWGGTDRKRMAGADQQADFPEKWRGDPFAPEA
ncbi:MAG: nuclear transport factor 2 family protein, partial [Caulobacterales bacterium]|nr:nuclear transport factor 2 family protein [Caulobacterales bacterium]